MGWLDALLQRCQLGDAEALDELIRRWERRLFYYVRRTVENEPDAWDVLQQTWARVLRGLRGVKDAERLVPWMYRIARNAALSHRSSLLARERWVDREAAVDDLVADKAAEPAWSAEEVHRGMERLSAHHREALTLFFLNDLSVAEMAGVLGVSEGTVKSRLFYGKRALREALETLRSRS